jgi:cell division protein FtsB
MDSAKLNSVKNSNGTKNSNGAKHSRADAKHSHASGAKVRNLRGGSGRSLRSQDPQVTGADEKCFDFLKQHARGLLALIVMVLLVHDVFGTHGFLAMKRTEREIKRVQADLDHLDKENQDLEQQVQDLKTDPRTIERLAREGSLLARPGEIIIKIPQSQWTESSAKTKP